MARIARANLSKTARAKLKAKGANKPHFDQLRTGLSLGYEPGRPGRWVARLLGEDGRYRQRVLGDADDLTGADGVRVLALDQAKAEAARWAGEVSDPTAAPCPTVAAAVRAYLIDRKRAKGADSAHRAELTAEKYIFPHPHRAGRSGQAEGRRLERVAR